MDLSTLRGVAMFLVVLAPPAIAVFRHPGRGLRLTERFLLALALAPFALVVPALLLALLLHLPPDWCLWQAEFLWVVAALWPRSPAGTTVPAAGTAAHVPDLATAPAPGEPLPGRGHGFPSIAALASAALAALLVAGVALTTPMVRVWSDAWFHAAAALEVARASVPPQDPNFAGIPLYYPWIFHFLLSMIGAGCRLSPFHAMALLNAWAAAVTALASAQLAYRAFGRGAAMWVGAIAVAGLDPFGWIFWLVRGMVGETAGLGSMLGILASTDGAGVSLSWQFPPSHVSLLNRFWTGTALTPAIALGVATAWSVARTLDRPPPPGGGAAWLRTLVLALAMFAIHPAYAAFATTAIAIGLIAVLAGGGRRGPALGMLGACALATAAGLVWVRLCSVPGSTTAIGPGLYTRNLWSLLLAVGPWWVIAIPGFAAGVRGGSAARFAMAAALAAVAVALGVVLPEFNSDKLFYLAWVSLAPLAAAGVVWWGDRLRLPAMGRAALIAALIVPSAGLYTLGTASDRRTPGVVIRGDSPGARHKPLATGQENAGYKFIRTRLPRDVVVIESPRPTVNEPMPVLAERPVFCGSLDVYLYNHMGPAGARDRELLALLDEFEVRRGIQRRLFTDGQLNEAQDIYLQGFSRPLALFLRRDEVSDVVWDAFRFRADWDELLANEEIRLYRFVPRGFRPVPDVPGPGPPDSVVASPPGGA
jgi:hypothetical protein